MKRKIVYLISLLFIPILLLFLFVYMNQEALIFYPNRLNKDYVFKFEGKYEEKNISVKDGTLLNTIWFKADSSKGLIFYLHGNAGALDHWGQLASVYSNLKYDVCMIDYRGYGKSEGTINSQSELYSDIQTVYDSICKYYSADQITILGYSIGTGPAAHLASNNAAKRLILQAPYYSLVDLMKIKFPFIPTFLLKYRFETNLYLSHCKMPVVLFHGTSDNVIPYASSQKLKTHFKPNDTLITLKGQGHNNFSDNPEYLSSIAKILY